MKNKRGAKVTLSTEKLFSQSEEKRYCHDFFSKQLLWFTNIINKSFLNVIFPNELKIAEVKSGNGMEISN